MTVKNLFFIILFVMSSTLLINLSIFNNSADENFNFIFGIGMVAQFIAICGLLFVNDKIFTELPED